MTVEEQVISIFKRHTDTPVTLATTAADMDSLAFMSAITDVENEFRVITNEEYAGLHTVGDLVELLQITT